MSLHTPLQHMPRSLVAAAAALALVSLAGRASAVSFTGLGAGFGGDPFSTSQFFGVANNGRVVANGAYNGGVAWTSTSGWQSLGVRDVRAIAGDGTLVGTAYLPFGKFHPFVWTPGGVLDTLSFSPYAIDEGFATAISADGSHVAGLSAHTSDAEGARTVTWNRTSNGIDANLGQAPNVPGFAFNGTVPATLGITRPTGISNNGDVVAGYATIPGNESGEVGFLWQAGTGYTMLLESQRVNAMSADGSVLVGTTYQQRAVRWDNGVLTELGSLGSSVPATDKSEALGMSADGRLVVGLAKDNRPGTTFRKDIAFVWQESAASMASLQDTLAAKGVDLTGWTLTSAKAVSANGRNIVGTGTYNGAQQLWVVGDLFLGAYHWRQGANGDLSGSFADVAAWTDASGYAAGGLLPGAVDDVVFANAGTPGMGYTVDLGATTQAIQSLTVSAGNPRLTNGTLQAASVSVRAGAILGIQQGSLIAESVSVDGGAWSLGVGGQATVRGVNIPAGGVLTLDGGMLTVGNTAVPARMDLSDGNVVHHAGSLRVHGHLSIGGNGSAYVMSPSAPGGLQPTLTTDNLQVQAGGSFNQHGGKATVNQTIDLSTSGGAFLFRDAELTADKVDAGGFIVLSGGSLHAQALAIKNAGTLEINSGNWSDPSGSYVAQPKLVVDAGIVNQGKITIRGVVDWPNNTPTVTVIEAELVNDGRLDIQENFSDLRWTGNLTNNGQMTVRGEGTLNLSGSLTNHGDLSVVLQGNRNIVFNTGGVENHGRIKVDGLGTGSLTWTNNFVLWNSYISDPAVNIFDDLSVGADGHFEGGVGDEFLVNGDFTSMSTSGAWNVSDSLLGFVGGTTHTFLASQDVHWGILQLGQDDQLLLQGDGITFTFDTLSGIDDVQSLVARVDGSGSFTLVISSAFGGGPLVLSSDKLNAAPVPEPQSAALLLAGLGGLGWLARRRGGHLIPSL